MRCLKCQGTMKKVKVEFANSPFAAGGFLYEIQTWKCTDCGYEEIHEYGASD